MFVGPCEHHSNLLPWREKGAKVCAAHIFIDLILSLLTYGLLFNDLIVTEYVAVNGRVMSEK